MNGKVCLDCRFSRAINSNAYCREKHMMVKLGRESCELFKDGLVYGGQKI